MAEDSLVGKTLDHPLTSPAAGVALSFLPGPLGAVFGALLSTAAAERTQERIDRTFIKIKTQLEIHENKLETLSEPQLKLVMETIRTVTETMNEEKLDFLIEAVSNCVTGDYCSDYEASVLGRLVRDISADEIRLLSLAASEEHGIVAASRRGRGQEGFMVIIVSALEDYDQIQSLLNMRLLEEASFEGRIGGKRYVLTSWARKLLALLEPKESRDSESQD